MNRQIRLASLAGLAVIAAAGSCTHRSPTQTPAHPLLREMAAQPAASSRPASSAPIGSATPPPSPSAPRAPAPECQKLTLVDACSPPDPVESKTALSSDDLAAWYAQRGATPPNDSTEPSCAPVKVGPDGEQALACALIGFPEGDPSSPTHVFRVTMDWTVRAVRGHRVQTLASIRYLMDVLDKEMEEQTPLFAIGVSLAADGRSVAVTEPRPNACAQAAQKLAASQKEAAAAADAEERRVMLAWEKFDAKLLAGICKQPRVWTWQQGKFRPQAAAPSGSTSPSARGTTSF
jgi:hypothetical protein